MGRPLKLHANSGGDTSLKEMSDSEIYWTFTYPMLKKFAAEHSAGSLQTGTDGTYIEAGEFVDDYRIYNPGAHGFSSVANTRSSSTLLRQRSESVTESFIRPVEWNGSSLQEMSDADIDTYIITPTLNALANGDVGSYRMKTTNPGGTGNTWITRITLSQLDSTDDEYNKTYLWQLTDKSSSAYQYALKTRTEGLQQIDHDDTEELVGRLRNKIISTGIGKYHISTSAPANGTWATRGNGFTDTIYAMANQDYAGTYAGAYAGAYSRNFAGSYTTGFALVYNGFTGTYYTGSFTGYYTGYFTGYYTGNYTGYYTGNTVQSTTENSGTYYLRVRTA